MPEMLEYMREKFDRLADKIVKFLMGLNGHEVEVVQVRVPDIRKVIGACLVERLPPSSSWQGRH
jgi:hypothetical protein